MVDGEEIPFIEGWELVRSLGDGTFGNVMLAVHRESRCCVAAKIVDLERLRNTSNMIEREINVHKLLKHENIIKYHGNRTIGKYRFIFTEYASGGELFDKIIPDHGMKTWEARSCFEQLLAGIEHMHNIGIAHRDIKPENLLLDQNNILKIADFGLATAFRDDENCVRKLTRYCGTPEYSAPEISNRIPYHAVPADLFSCGITLVAMLAGKLPWNVAKETNRDYQHWKRRNFTIIPWKELDPLTLQLLAKILDPVPARRFSIQQIRESRWFRTTSPYKPEITSEPTTNIRKISFSQPDETIETDSGIDMKCVISQPINLDNILFSTPTTFTIPLSKAYCFPVRRMTRFWSDKSHKQIFASINQAVTSLSCQMKHVTQNEVIISTIDSFSNPLKFRATIYARDEGACYENDFDGTVDNSSLVEFRLSQGNGIEFKRLYGKIFTKLESLYTTR